ncbi:MAG: UDP-N-acetylglucosamine--N-acetylmuramyl-(pentapeptide) pyrophosphoryl-undecaprenol [Verrucomicrobiota bacterium]|jgi:UDP-N-acetylglucosamine--N-acetylmuramyl-(pentapeptide) pyrophosphoryl-undecaprenol N-acetylglucosamine transferase
MLLISEKEIDATATRDCDGFRIEKVVGEGLQSKSPLALLRFWMKLRAAKKRCAQLYADFNPAAVLGMGGFTCFAPIVTGRRRGIPTFVHESNAIPGRANKLNARYVTRVLLGFEACRPHFRNATCEVVGTPIRSALRKAVNKCEAREAFGLERDKCTLLVMGGSQGASGINKRFVEALPSLAGRAQAIHITGKADELTTRNAYVNAGIPAFVAPFHHAMQDAYAAADLAIARSGAASLTELSHFGLPSVLIPYPFAADDHQTANARIFSEASAGILLPESQAGGGALAATVAGILDTPGRLAEMSANSRKLAVDDAAERVTDLILRHGT